MRTVLIVDDEWAVADVLDALLTDEGYHVVTASNGQQALERMRDPVPDLILLDFMMPVMDGAGFLAALAASGRPHAPVIVMSSLPETVIAERCAGYATFLRKPFRIAEVMRAIARAGAFPN